MRRRPWAIRLLAFLFFIAPLLDAFASWQTWGGPFSSYLKTINSQGTLGILKEVLPLPFAGLSIYLMKRWSYFVFLFLTGWVFVISLLNWPSSFHIFSPPLMFAIFIFDLILVGYFLLPEVRAGYFNPRLRWWEQLPRYKVAMPVEIEYQNTILHMVSVDASSGGLLVSFGKSWQPRPEICTILFKYSSDFEFRLPVKIVYERRNHFEYLYGLQFFNVSPEDNQRLRKFGARMNREGLKTLRASGNLFFTMGREFRNIVKRMKIALKPGAKRYRSRNLR